MQTPEPMGMILIQTTIFHSWSSLCLGYILMQDVHNPTSKVLIVFQSQEYLTVQSPNSFKIKGDPLTIAIWPCYQVLLHGL